MKLDYVLAGSVFGAGLAVSGMVQPEVVLSFLLIQDLGLLLVMGFAVAITLIGFWLVPKIQKKPFFGESFSLRFQQIDDHLIYGSVFFGIGWGISGLCPGASIASIGSGNFRILIALAAMVAGAYAYAWYLHIFENR